MPDPAAEELAPTIRSPAGASCVLHAPQTFFMTYDAALPHLFQALAHQLVLVGLQFEVVGDGLVNQVAARTVLRGRQRIERCDLIGGGPERWGFSRTCP